ncbi:hypothetical protein ACFY36_32100 [Actinoplanes sp. NPDC000266]
MLRKFLTCLVLAATAGCGDAPKPPPPAPAAPSPSPSPSPSIPALWPTAVVAAMPPEMVSRYEERLADFYNADTLEELPVYVCVALAVNQLSWPYEDQLKGDVATVMTRAEEYDTQTAAGVRVYADHNVRNDTEYIDQLAMDDTALVQLSLDHFCPEMTAAWKDVQPSIRNAVILKKRRDANEAEDEYNVTHPARRFADGRYTVGREAGMVLPGTYRLKGPLADCYWERSSGSGEIINHNFVTNAPSGVQVTVRAGEGFTSRGCTDDDKRWERTS